MFFLHDGVWNFFSFQCHFQIPHTVVNSVCVRQCDLSLGVFLLWAAVRSWQWGEIGINWREPNLSLTDCCVFTLTLFTSSSFTPYGFVYGGDRSAEAL